jgi:YD repeat-containing protein
MHLSKLLFISLIGCFFLPFSEAAVSPQNGKFSAEFDFFSTPDDPATTVSVVYNSMTPYQGIFGWGWGCELETQLKVTQEGLLLNEFGDGAQNRFAPSLKDNSKNVQEEIGQILTLTKQTGVYWSAAQVNKFKQHLQSDPAYRQEQWKILQDQGKVKLAIPVVGSSFVSDHFQHQVITREEQGYLRHLANGGTQLFSEDGRLQQMTTPDGVTKTLKYSESGQLIALNKSNGANLKFIYNEQGFVSRIENTGKENSNFEYDLFGNLTKASLQNGQRYSFKYDPPMHWLFQITDANKQTTTLSYFPLKDKNAGRVQEFKTSDGTTTTYEYEGDSTQVGSYKVKIHNQRDKMKAESSNQFFTHVNDSGELSVYRQISIMNGQQTDTTFNDCCHLPTHVKSGSEEVFYEYTASGALLSKTTKTAKSKISYNSKCSLPIQASHYTRDPRSKAVKETHWVKLNYDSKCRPVSGQDSDLKSFVMTYDSEGRLGTILFGGKNKRQLILKYENEEALPKEIQDSVMGVVKGPEEIKKLLALASETVALLVSEMANSQSI